MPKQKLNEVQQELWDELQSKTKEFYDGISEEEKKKWPNEDLFRPLRLMEQEYLKKSEKQQISTHNGYFNFNSLQMDDLSIPTSSAIAVLVQLLFKPYSMKLQYCRSKCFDPLVFI